MLIRYEEELGLVKGILTAAGFPEEDAATIAKVIAHSDFTGVYSHGLSRLTRYMRQIEAGSLNPRPDFRRVEDSGAVSVYDGDNGSGIVAVNRAYDELREKAKQYGVAMACGRRNANIGCGSYYGWRAAADDLVALVTCNTYAFTSPFGGADRLIGTNPIPGRRARGSAHPRHLGQGSRRRADDRPGAGLLPLADRGAQGLRPRRHGRRALDDVLQRLLRHGYRPVLEA